MKYPEKMQEIQNLILSSKNNINADMLSDAYKNNLYKL